MNQKMKIKNIIFTAIFTVLFFLVFVVIHAVFGMNPVSFFFFYGIAAIPCGIIYMYMRAKVPCEWSILLMAVIMALVGILMGMVWPAAAGMLIGGILAEFISRIGHYTDKKWNAVGYIVFIGCIMIGQTSYMIFGTKAFIAGMISVGAAQEYLDVMVATAKGPIWFAGFATAIVGAWIGGMVGNTIFKKHFAKLAE